MYIHNNVSKHHLFFSYNWNIASSVKKVGPDFFLSHSQCYSISCQADDVWFKVCIKLTSKVLPGN